MALLKFFVCLVGLAFATAAAAAAAAAGVGAAGAVQPYHR